MTSFMLGCASLGGDIQRTINAYEEGRYFKAVVKCEDLKRRKKEMNDKGRVRYHAFCGLAYHHEGNHEVALPLLKKGWKLYRQGTPGWLKPHIVKEMQTTLDELAGTTEDPAVEAAPASSSVDADSP